MWQQWRTLLTGRCWLAALMTQRCPALCLDTWRTFWTLLAGTAGTAVLVPALS